MYIYYVQVGEDGKIIDARFKTFGCGSAIGSISYQDVIKPSDVINQVFFRLYKPRTLISGNSVSDSNHVSCSGF